MSQQEKVKGVCDILFLIDVSGSMQDCIDALFENIATFVAGLEDKQATHYISDWRASVWGYRDVKADGDNWLVRNPFVNDVASLRAQFGAIEARGGEDEPESLLDALYLAATLQATAKGAPADANLWRYRSSAARVIIVFSDATFHPTMSIPEAAGGTVTDVGNTIATNRFATFFFVPGFPCYDDLAVVDKAQVQSVCAADHPEPPKALQEFTADRANFQKVMMILGKTVSQTSQPEVL
jgi:hypothetical protein